MGDIQWVMRSIVIAFMNDTTRFIIAFALILTIINMIWRIFHENDK